MKRTKSKAPLKVHTTPPAEERTADLSPGVAAVADVARQAIDALGRATADLQQVADEKAAMAKAAQDVVDEKIEAAKPKPRRVGPLRKIHLATLDRAAALTRPMLEQLAELRRQVGAVNAQAIDDVLEDLGQPKREPGEDARVIEEGGEAYVELSRAPTGPAGPSQGSRRRKG